METYETPLDPPLAPIKQLPIPCLELCGAHLLADLLNNVKVLLRIPLDNIYAWTNSTVVLSWLIGNLRRFITFVANHVSCVVELVSPDKWNHIDGRENPANCASRGILPLELLSHELWWKCSPWLSLPTFEWPNAPTPPSTDIPDECVHTCPQSSVHLPLIPFNQYSSFTHLLQVTA